MSYYNKPFSGEMRNIFSKFFLLFLVIKSCSFLVKFCKVSIVKWSTLNFIFYDFSFQIFKFSFSKFYFIYLSWCFIFLCVCWVLFFLKVFVLSLHITVVLYTNIILHGKKSSQFSWESDYHGNLLPQTWAICSVCSVWQKI